MKLSGLASVALCLSALAVGYLLGRGRPDAGLVATRDSLATQTAALDSARAARPDVRPAVDTLVRWVVRQESVAVAAGEDVDSALTALRARLSLAADSTARTAVEAVQAAHAGEQAAWRGGRAGGAGELGGR